MGYTPSGARECLYHFKMDTPKNLYKYHVDNLRELDRTFHLTARMLRASLARQDEPVAKSLLRTQTLLLGILAEGRLAKLLYEDNGFSHDERIRIRTKKNLLDRWKLAAEIGFRKHYQLPHCVLSSSTLPHSAYSRYTTISTLLQDELAPALELRNKLAHGQWKYTLTHNQDAISSQYMQWLNTENALSLQFKQQLLNFLSDAIHDLVVSPLTFERDFDAHFKRIEQVRFSIKKRSYAKWVKQLQQKYFNGRQLSKTDQLTKAFPSVDTLG